jgi:hypothetical protein
VSSPDLSSDERPIKELISEYDRGYNVYSPEASRHRGGLRAVARFAAKHAAPRCPECAAVCVWTAAASRTCGAWVCPNRPEST